MYPGTKPVCFGHTRVCTRVRNLFFYCHTRVWVPNLFFCHTRVCTRVPNLFWSYSGMYPGIKPVLVILMYAPRYHNRVCTRVPNLYVLVVLGYVPGYQTWLFGSYPGMYPGTKSVCLVIPGYVSGYQTCFFCHTRLLYKGTKPVCFDHTRVCTWVPREYTHY